MRDVTPHPSRRPSMPISRSTRARATAAFLALALAAPYACTDLSEQPYSTLTPNKFYQTDDEVRAGLAAVYSQFNTATTGNYHYHNTISSDEQVIPVRGQDWFDNGAHLEAQRHLWSPTSVAGLGSINSAWTQAYTGVARANVVIEAIGNLPIANKARTIAEARLLRAYFYYQLVDL